MTVGRGIAVLSLAAWSPCVAAAQPAEIAVIVRDSVSGAPLTGAIVEALDGRDVPIDRRVTNSRGHARLATGDIGAFTVSVNRIGYLPARRSNVRGPATVSVLMIAAPVSLDPIAVSASRSPQTALDAPVSVTVIDRETIDRHTAVTVIDRVRTLPGVGMMSSGLVSRRYTVRGQNFGTSSQLRTFTDFRSNALPAQSVNLPYVFPSTADDLERIELLRGPAASIWGPHTHRGVLHLVSRSPFESGTTVSATAGGRSVFQGVFRHARRLSDRFAFKVSAEFFRGNDWTFSDPLEQTARDEAIAAGADPTTLLVGRRDFEQQWTKTEGRFDWRPDGGTEVIASAGYTRSPNVFDAVGFSGNGVQFRDVSTWFVQSRFHRGDLFLNGYFTASRTDSSYITANGFGIVDDSRAFTVQAQHAVDIGSVQRFQYGADVTRTIPETGGTTHQGTENIDDLTEAGAYLHSETALSSSWDLIASIRGDYHSVFDDADVSPRVAAVFKPAPTHALRASVTRGFSTPGTDVLFNDFPVASLGPYDLRLVGMRQPLTFRRDCGGPCMRSPFNADPSEYQPIDATLHWGAVVAALMDQGVDISAIPAPTDTQVQSQLAALDLSTFAFVPVDASFVRDLPAWTRGTLRTFELGYKGVIGDRVLVGVDVYFNRAGGFVGREFVPTANVFFDQPSLEAYLAGFMSAAQAQQLAEGIAMQPVGTVTPEQATDPVALMLVEPESQGTTIDYQGLDVALTVQLTGRWHASTNYSWVSDDEILDAVGSLPFQFFNPKHRGAVSVGYEDAAVGLVASLDVRGATSFPAFNAFVDGRGDGYVLVDAMVGHELPWSRDIVVSMTGYNILNNDYRPLPGTARNGRLLLVRVKAQLF